jgi:hypothetical protein
MIATGLTFALGVGAVSSIVGLIVVLVGQGSFLELLRMSGRLSVVAFLLGIAFSGILAVTARSRRFAELSIARFASLGAGAGLLYFLLISINAWSHWSLANAIGNLVILTLLGGGSAAGILMLARRGRPALKPGEESRFLDDG